MDEATYKLWWPLHLRTALGEPLNTEEKTVYEAGLRALEAEEPPIQSSIEELRQARQKMRELQAEYQRMQAHYEAMQAEIDVLETQLDAPEKQLLGVGD